MEVRNGPRTVYWLLQKAAWWLLLRFIICILSVGPIPSHVAFIMDGNKRYAKEKKLRNPGAGHDAGSSALEFMHLCCRELGIKYVTAYAFSIDNFKRSPQEVQHIMGLVMKKIQLLSKKDSILFRYGVRVHFAGNLKLLSVPIREAAERLMALTAENSNSVLTLCVAYTSTDEIVHAVRGACEEVSGLDAGCGIIKLGDIEKHMYMEVAPDPNIVVRTSRENRLSNFLLWQSGFSYLYTTATLWPAFGFWNLVWVVLNFQRYHASLEKMKKLL